MPKKRRKPPKREQNLDAIGACASGSSSPQNDDIVDIVFGRWLPKKEKILEEEFRRIDSGQSGQASENEESNVDSQRRIEYADDTVVFHNSAEDFEVMKTLESIINEREDCQVDQVTSAVHKKTKITVLKKKTKAIQMKNEQVVDKVTSAVDKKSKIPVLNEKTKAIQMKKEQVVDKVTLGVDKKSKIPVLNEKTKAIQMKKEQVVDKVKITSAKARDETKMKINVLQKNKALQIEKEQVVDKVKVTSAEFRGEMAGNIKVLQEETNEIPKEEEQGVSWWKIGGAVLGTGLLAFAGYTIYKYINH